MLTRSRGEPSHWFLECKNVGDVIGAYSGERDRSFQRDVTPCSDATQSERSDESVVSSCSRS
jgi:hypothetical protein